MMPPIREVYNDFRQGITPSTGIEYGDDGRIDSISSNTLSGHFVGAKHISNNTFAIIKVKPINESQNEKMQRNITQPHKPFDSKEKFKHCVYQLGTIEIPSFRKKETRANKNMLHDVCHWNRPGVTRLRTAMSAQQLENAWLEHIQIE
jgi:hypothetical protein